MIFPLDWRNPTAPVAACGGMGKPPTWYEVGGFNLTRPQPDNGNPV
jgi:hypothetical protein